MRRYGKGEILISGILFAAAGNALGYACGLCELSACTDFRENDEDSRGRQIPRFNFVNFATFPL